MISFSVCLAVLIAGYFVYGRVVERIFGPDPGRITPAVANPDGVDFVVLPRWKIFMIQFLNIAGLGPIFGAILGAKFGISSYLWNRPGNLVCRGRTRLYGRDAVPALWGEKPAGDHRNVPG